MKRRIRRNLAKRQREIHRRLAAAWSNDLRAPTLPTAGPMYELGERSRAIAHGGIGLVQRLVGRLRLARAINENVRLLKRHLPYHESDHVLNIAFNVLCGGQTLDDIELRRNDAAYLDALGVDAIPDPTTAGDFCRRFEAKDVEALMDAINAVRVKVWKKQGAGFLDQPARIDADGTIVGTASECKGGIGLSYKGAWGYHPLLVSLANTSEPLFIANRSGNQRSSTGAADYLNRAISLCREAGFSDILLRGDTDFSQTQHLDGWDRDDVRFVFGFPVRAKLKTKASSEDREFAELARRAKRAFVEEDRRRTRPPRIKESIVRERGYKNIRLKSEDVAEFDYKPVACNRAYRIVVLRKNLSVERGELVLVDDVRYFFYITNSREFTAEQVVFEANDRCNQENLIAQLKGGVRALHAPVNTLNANWAYMVMASLAWTLKAWMALSLPISPRWRSKHEATRRRWLRMDFRTFLNAVIAVPAQVVSSGRRRILRLLAWRPELLNVFRLLDGL